MNNPSDNVIANDKCDATVIRGAGIGESIRAIGRYEVVCRDANGVVKWRDHIDNLVTTVGKNLIGTGALGNAAQGAVVMGLKGAGAAAAGDTQASHAGWLEVGLANAPTYTGNRPTPSFSAAAAGVVATSAAVAFAITSSGTVAGCFINVGGSATKDNTTGTLLSAGDFSGGSKTVASGDTLNVSYSLTIA